MCVLFLYVFCVIHHSQSLLSNQDFDHKQSSDGGEGHAEPRGTRQTRSSVAQVSGTARLGHGVDSGIGVGKVHILSLVAFGHI